MVTHVRAGCRSPSEFLDPARLADSPTTDTGAPLVSADGMVLSSNGRTLAIRSAYAMGLAASYAEAVRARAAEMGLAVPDSMRAPVLVRRLSAETSREDLVRAAELSNRPQILSRNESETAEADAATLLSGGFLDLLQPGDNGELLGEANRAFMDAFINATGDQGLRTADGFPTEAAQKRVRRAVLAALFQDLPNRRDLIRAAVEDADELHVTRELAGLMRGAPAILRSAAARPAYDLRGEIGIALADYLDFKRQGGRDIDAYLSQGQLFDERPPEVAAVLREIGKRRDATSISDFLQDYARRAEAQAAEGQDTFAFFAPPTKLDLLAAASADTAPAEAEQGALRLSVSGIPTPAELAEAARQYDEIVARYANPDGTRKPGWMKAPNGADTHLAERQWVQVRTKNFKRWFGDWEARYYSQGWQDKIDPAAIRALPALDISGYAPLADKAAIAEAFETFGEVTNANDGRKVRFPANVAGRMVYKRNYVGAFKKLFETSVKAWSENETQFEGHKAHPNIRAYHQYVNKFTDAAGEHYVRFTVREDNPGKGAQNNIHGAEVTAVEVYEKGNDSTLPEFQTGRSESPDGARTPRQDRKLALFLSDFNPSSVSKVVDENGEPLVVWHGSAWNPLAEEPGKAVFRDAYRGTGSGDNGFFGRGFYFAFTEDEAQTYGRRTGGYFLNLRNPFVFIDEMDFIDGLRTFDMAGSDVAPIVNLSDKFPETASMFTVTGWTFDANGEGTPTEVSLRDFAKEIRAILAEPEIREKRDPITEALSEFQKRHGFGSVDIPRITDVSQESEYTDELKKKGHDGVLQSKDGDEAVAFSPSQIKSATDNTGVFSARPDVRYSISGLYTGSAADYAERVPVLDKDGNVTGYRIDNAPSLVHVGSGEGSQVYGWGLYASDQRGVAEGYAKAARDEQANRLHENGRLVRVDGMAGNVPYARLQAYQAIESALWRDRRIKTKAGLLGRLRKSDLSMDAMEEAERLIAENDYNIPSAATVLYEQTFFTDRADGEETERHLLKWYEPVSDEQRKWIVEQATVEGASTEKDAWGRSILAFHGRRLLMDDWSKGEVAYKGIAHALGSEHAASDFLARAGIDGVKYPVDSFGGKGVKDGDKAGWNYVSFRDDNIRVDHKWVDGAQRYSIVPIDGRDTMVVANSLLTAKEAQDETKVRDMLRNTIVGKEFAQLGEPTDKPVKVSPKFVKEFWNSEQAKSQRKIAKLWRAKVGAAVNLEDLLATTPLGPKEAPKHTNGQFKNGATFYRCPTKFGVFVPGMGINVYPCNLLILETKSGKRYAFDIADMEKPTLAAIGSLSGETLELLQGGGSNGGSVRLATLPQAPGSVNPASRDSFTPIGAGLANESIFAGLLAADYVSGKDRGDETYERLRRALHVEDAGTLAEARAYAREMAEVRRYGLAGRAEASVRDAAAQGGQGADAIFGDAPSPDWTAEDYARHYEQFAAARALADAALGGMQEGVHLGAAARKAIDQARRNLIREAQGIDYEETVRHGGIDIAATLLGIDPDKFGAWGGRRKENVIFGNFADFAR